MPAQQTFLKGYARLASTIIKYPNKTNHRHIDRDDIPYSLPSYYRSAGGHLLEGPSHTGFRLFSSSLLLLCYKK